MAALCVTARLPLPGVTAAPAGRPSAHRLAPRRAPRATTPRLAAQGKDFDTILADVADKFEKMDSNKKVAVVGWSAAALGAVAFAEKVCHTVGLNFLIGGPVQLLGILTIPGIVLKALDGKDLVAEAGEYVSSIAKRLPGLDK